MFHLTSQLLGALLQPLAWIALLLVPVVRGTRGTPRRLACAALLLVLLYGWEWPADALLARLEDQVAPYAARETDAHWIAGFTGVVVLGGALQPGRMWTRPGQLPLRPSAERMVATARLAREAPGLKVLFSGGEGELITSGLSEAQRARQVFTALGLPPDRVQYEDASRDTWENAVFSARLPDVDPHQPWLLLSSAVHLPRALVAFGQAGWNVTPCPVDFRAPAHTDWWRFDWDTAPMHWQLALHEWMGLLAYRVRGTWRS